MSLVFCFILICRDQVSAPFLLYYTIISKLFLVYFGKFVRSISKCFPRKKVYYKKVLKFLDFSSFPLKIPYQVILPKHNHATLPVNALDKLGMHDFIKKSTSIKKIPYFSLYKNCSPAKSLSIS